MQLSRKWAGLTVGDSLAAAGHDAIAQLDDLGDADDLLGVVALVGQQHQEEENVGYDGLGIPATHKNQTSGYQGACIPEG